MELQQKDIEQYLKDDKEQKMLLNILATRIEDIDRAISDNVKKFKAGDSLFAMHLNNTENDILHRISSQLVEKVHARNNINLKKLKGLKQKKPMFKNEEIKQLL